MVVTVSRRYSEHNINGALSQLALYSGGYFLTQAVLDSHVQALRGVLPPRFSDTTGDIEIDLIFDEKDESRPHLLNHYCLDVRLAARSSYDVAKRKVNAVGHLIQIAQRNRQRKKLF